MSTQSFDALTRALARATTRREAIRILLAAAGATAVASLISGCENDPVGAVEHECDAASACGDRQYCNEQQTCICILTAEGVRRCGKIPSTCNVQLCQTSADCASLGEGWFCDTPNSGCCTNPPKELPRCIAPCAPSDPNPPTGCASDAPTLASIEAARTAVAGGATEVALSPAGCMRYRRTLTNGVLTGETILFEGAPILIYEHTPARSTGRQDADRDGFFEWRVVVERGDPATAQDDRVEATWYSPTTQNALERKTYTRTGNTIHVVVEQPDRSGNLTVVARYERDLWISARAAEEASEAEDMLTSVARAPCSAADCSEAALREKFRNAVNQGLQCLHRHGARGLEARLTKALYRNPIRLRCAAIPPASSGHAVRARTSQPWPFFAHLNPEAFESADIEVNQNEFCNLSPSQQLSTLFHEMMHLEITDHNPHKETAPNNQDVDQLYACEALCFNPPGTVSQCSCAKCLETTKCDPRCSTSLGFQSCPDDFGAWCPCPTRLRWYNSCSRCLAECPSGLGCFGFSFCLPDNSSRCTPATCP